MKLLCKIIAFILIIHSYAYAGLPVSRSWQKAWFGGGGSFVSIKPDVQTANKIYAISDVSGNLYSTDKGENWDYMNTGITSVIQSAFAQSTVDPNIMYVLGKKLMKSTNRGETWAEVGSFVGTRTSVYKSIAIDRNDPNIVYIGLDNGIIKKTSDGGSTWEDFATPFGSNSRVSFVYINPTSTVLIAGSITQGMVIYDLVAGTSADKDFVETNGTKNGDFATYTVSGTEHFCVPAGSHINCTADDGANWDSTEDAIPDTNSFIFRMEARLLANTHVKFIVNYQLLASQYTNVTKMSADDGDTWTNISSNVTVDSTNDPSNIWSNFGVIGNVRSIAADPFDESIWYITTDWRIFRSDDGGTNWTEKVKGAQNTVISDLTVSPNGIIFGCGMDVGCYYSTNGTTWTAAIPHISNGNAQGFAIAGNYWRVVTTGTEAEWNAGNGHVIVTTSYFTDFIPRVARSIDNGITWSIVSSGLPTTELDSTGSKNDAAWGIGYPRSLAKSADGNTLYIGIDGYSGTENGGIFKSSDNGVTWSRTTQPSQWKTYNAIAVDPTDSSGNTAMFSEWFYDSPDLPYSYKTTNGGDTWVQSDAGIGMYDMAYNSIGNVFRVGLNINPNIDLSSNGGLGTWMSMKKLNNTSNIADGLLVDPHSDQRIFVGINDGIPGGSIYMTKDALSGNTATWYDLTGDLPVPSGVQAIAINYSEGTQGYLYIATNGGGVFKLNLAETTPTTYSNMHIGY